MAKLRSTSAYSPFKSTISLVATVKLHGLIVAVKGIILERLGGATLCSLRTSPVEVKKAIIDSARQAVQKLTLYDVVHSDLKLDNLMYTGQRVIIIDFDISEIAQEKWYAHDINLNDINTEFEGGGYHTRDDWT